MAKQLSAESLRKTYDPKGLSCESVEELKPLESIIGQDRAVKALKLGLGIKSLGFNIYVSGQPGTGKLTAVKRFLEELAKGEDQPCDWCYVYNFEDAYEPKKLDLPSGMGKALKQDMSNLIDEAQQELTKAFESEDYANKREEALSNLDKKKRELFTKAENMAQKEGFVIKHAPGRIITVPLKGDEPMKDEDFQQLSEEERKGILRKQDKLQDELKSALRQNREYEKEASSTIQELEQEVALYAIKILIDELREKYKEQDHVLKYLDAVQEDILDNLSEFLKPKQPQGNNMQAALQANLMQAMSPPFFIRYEVNVLIDNSEKDGAPVIIELNPTYNNLFGRVEKESQMGALYTDHTLIRKGSLHRANGGYLVVPLEDLLRNFHAYDSLKRALRNKEIIIEELTERLGFMTTKTLKPEPIPLSVQVIIIGERKYYHLLYQLDSDFKELFKVKADFDTSMDFTKENERNYLAFVCKICTEEKLTPLNNTALAKMLEYASRLAEDQEKLSTRFGEISDIIREASYYAKTDGNSQVTGEHITKAIDEKFYRSNLLQEKITDLIQKEIIRIDHEGEKVGQVNGLAVYDLGDIAFGKPNRITVSTSIGKEGVVDIEREAKLGGKIHTKGVMILSGFLEEKFSQKEPMSLSARVVFEQSYSEVEGDSASSTELYAILSSLSHVPIKQGIAVTGSVNQKGEVQAIGGVNEKIEGFFEVCQQKGLTGDQGVLIPKSNVKNLMLKEKVIEQVKAGQFRIWAVDTIEEGIEVLTGVKAGKQRKDGTYEKDSIYYHVNKRLEEITEKLIERKREEKEGV